METPDACQSCFVALPPGKSGRCKGCARARYCSGDCQKKDWPEHKSNCKRGTCSPDGIGCTAAADADCVACGAIGCLSHINRIHEPAACSVCGARSCFLSRLRLDGPPVVGPDDRIICSAACKKKTRDAPTSESSIAPEDVDSFVARYSMQPIADAIVPNAAEKGAPCGGALECRDAATRNCGACGTWACERCFKGRHEPRLDCSICGRATCFLSRRADGGTWFGPYGGAACSAKCRLELRPSGDVPLDLLLYHGSCGEKNFTYDRSMRGTSGFDLAFVDEAAFVRPPAADDEEEEESDDDLCVVCMSERRTHVFIPCGHLVICGKCCEAVKACVICRSKAKAIPVYKS